MSTAVIVTIVGLGVLVLGLAGYLVVIIWMLARIDAALGTVLARVQALARRAAAAAEKLPRHVPLSPLAGPALIDSAMQRAGYKSCALPATG